MKKKHQINDRKIKMSKKEPSKTGLKKSQKEDLSLEISFFEALIRENPDFVEALIPLAEDYTGAGRFEEGLKIDLKLSQLKPKDPTILYNLACSYSLLIQVPQSAETLTKAILLGYSDFEHLEKDPDLANLRSHPCFSEIRKKYIKK